MISVNSSVVALIICLQAICSCIFTTLGQYIYAYYLQIYDIPSNTTQNFSTILLSSYPRFKIIKTDLQSCTDNITDSSSGSDGELWAQEASANLFFRTTLCYSFPIVITTYILGVYTPTLGRKLVLTIPMLGSTVQVSIWLAIIYFDLAEYWWCISSFIAGLSGSTFVLHFIVALIVTDNTTEENRSIRFVFYEALETIVSAVTTFACGYYIKWRGFTDLYWISLGLEILSIVIVIIFIKSHSNTIDETTSLLSSSIQDNTEVQITQSRSLRTKFNDCFRIFHILSFKNRSYRKSISILLILFSYMFYLLACASFTSFLWFVLDAPFCWSSVKIGNYTALSLIAFAIFSFLGMKFFTYIGANDIIICIFSHLCFAISSLWTAFSKYSWQLYAGLLITPFADYQNSLTIPMISKFVEPHERNYAFALTAEISTIISNFGEALFNWIYGVTINHSRIFNLLLATGFSLVAFLLNICLFGVTRGIPNETLVSVSESEPVILSHSHYITHPGDILSSSLINSTTHLNISKENESHIEAESSTENSIITTENLVNL